MEKTPTPPVVAEEVHLKHIEEERFKFDKEAFEKASRRDLTLGQKMFYNLEKKGMKMSLQFVFKDAEKKDREIMNAELSFHFVIDHLEKFYEMQESGIPRFHRGIVTTLLSISLSTARGILYEKCAHKGLTQVIVPVIDPKKVLETTA